MIILLWILNFIISWANAWGVGKTWTETKAVGGPIHFMSWMGAIMSAIGFTWCYTVVMAFLAASITLEGESEPLLQPEQLMVFLDLAYIIYIFPLVGVGTAIMTHSWGVWWRSRSLVDGVTAGWNTYANLSNFYHAAEHLPDAIGNVGGFFAAAKEDGKGLIIIMTVGAFLGGILTTTMIIRSTARNTAMDRRAKYEVA